MNKWVIDKRFDFCYAHRVYVQKLREDFCSAGDTKCACRHMHGHQGHVHVFVEGKNLNEQNMVCDFKELGFLKDFFDTFIDHKFIVSLHDPLFDLLVGSYTNRLLEKQPNKILDRKAAQISGTDFVAASIYDVSDFDDCPEKEYIEGLLIVEFVPTSENLSKWIFDLAQNKLQQINVTVSRVEFFETPKSRSSYSKS